MSLFENNLPVIDRMQEIIDAWEAAADPRAVFLDCYRCMTNNMLAAIEAGEFHDADWVSRLLHRFADYYFFALDEYNADNPQTPAVWRIAHDQALHRETAVLQKLVLGVNAHINYDLVFALADLLAPEWRWLTPDQRQERFADHCHVNAIISRTIDEVQDEVVDRYSPAMILVDKLLGPLDEYVASRLISGWRDHVWQEATRYVELETPEERDQLRNQVEATTLDWADRILLR